MAGRRPFQAFQFRWKEPLGRPECPYLYRWMIVFFGWSIRLHHWIKSDDRRFFHDHACDLISIILKGWYYNVVPRDPEKPNVRDRRKIRARAGRPWFAKARAKHYLEIPTGGAWTLLFCGRPYHQWGFYVNGRKMRPPKYFKRYGIIQDEQYQ